MSRQIWDVMVIISIAGLLAFGAVSWLNQETIKDTYGMSKEEIQSRNVAVKAGEYPGFLERSMLKRGWIEPRNFGEYLYVELTKRDLYLTSEK